MPGMSGLEAIMEIKKNAPTIPVLVLSLHPEKQYATRVIKAGASGYVRKTAAVTELINAVRHLLIGRKYITPSVAEKLASDLFIYSEKAQHEFLTDREFGIMKLIASGKAILEIAVSLSLKPTTISTYRGRILAKMRMNTNAELTMYALQSGLI